MIVAKIAGMVTVFSGVAGGALLTLNGDMPAPELPKVALFSVSEPAPREVTASISRVNSTHIIEPCILMPGMIDRQFLVNDGWKTRVE